MASFSLSFLATSAEQLPPPGRYGNSAVEAVIFDRSDLFEDRWNLVWKNVELAISLYGERNVSFHFPVNDSDYVADSFVRSRLKDAYHRACELGIAGVVVHSNRIRKIARWAEINLSDDRNLVVEVLSSIKQSRQGCSTWLSLENMPVMDNWGIEIDPLFSFPQDFELLVGTPVDIVWDCCHYTNTLANVAKVVAGEHLQEWYPNFQTADLFDFLRLSHKIRHWHFSAFRGVATPGTQQYCREGVLPCDSTLGSSTYENVFRSLSKHTFPEAHIVFEVQEEDYGNRQAGPAIIKWASAQLSQL